MPLAVLPDGDFPATRAPLLEPGELLLLLTDGIVEAHGAEGNLFGIDRVFEVVRAHYGGTARRMVDLTVRAFCGAQSQLDDMTVVVIKATSPEGPTAAN
jgi:sigma-B regulation protein RsbU (phosphoserine phosphatase)